MEKITCLTDNDEPVDFFVLEETRINGCNYLLVTAADEQDDTSEDAEAYILKDESNENDTEAAYVFVEDEEELESVFRIFEELLDDDVEIEK